VLTLKEPIKLNSLRGILTASDILSEKIRANYDLLSTQFSPKELLLLLTASPEFSEDMGGMTTIAANTNIQNSQNLKLDVINNVINRILMSEHVDFTYQDQVYITTVLSKLGITNVAEFMKQVRTLTQENQSAYELLNLYQDNFAQLTSLTTLLDANRSDVAAKTEEAELPAEPDLRYFIHNEIYKRLGIGSIYQILNAFQRNQTVEQSVVGHYELKLAEQLRVSQELSLSELKSQTFYHNSVLLQHHANHYELGDIFSAPQTEEHVISEVTAAVLLSTIDNVMVSRMSHIQLGSHFWLDIKNAVSQSAENSLLRFELYHSERSVQNQRQSLYAEQLSALYREEISVVNRLLQQLRQDGAQISIADATSVTQIQDLKLEHYALTENADSLTTIDSVFDETNITASTEIVTKTTQQILNQSERKQLIQSAPQMTEFNSESVPAPRADAQLIYRTEESLVETSDESSEEKAGFSTEAVTKITQQILNRSERSEFQMSAPQTPASVLEAAPTPRADTELIHLTEKGIGEASGERSDEKAAHSTEAVTHLTQQILNQSGQSGHRASAPQTPESVSEPAPAPHSAPELIHRADEQFVETRDERPEEKIALSNENMTKITQQISNSSELKKFTFFAPQAAQSTLGAIPESREAEALVHPVRESYAETIERLSSAEKRILIAQQQSSQEFKYNSQNRITSNLMADFSKRTTLNQLQSSSEQQNIDASVRQDALIYQNSSQELSETIKNISVSAQTTEEETFLLQQQLALINQHNKEVFEKLQQQKLDHLQTVPPSVPDRKRMLSDALRAIENPEQVIREMLESPPVMQHREEMPGLDAILSQTDETTRKIYEAVLKYQQDPQAAVDSGLIRPANAGALNAEIIKTQEQKTVELAHRTEAHEQETRALHETAERVIEQFRELPGHKESYPPPQQQRPRVPIVHKTVENQVSDELLERLEQQNRKEEVRQTVDQTVTQETVSQTQINNLTQDVVAKTTEDITEIVNRTLARQIGTISDRVYSQMEKRLQTERARRGRF